MGKDGDDLVSLPSPPPPRPAARRAAIDAALRRFDGIPEAPAENQRPARPPLWATLHRRPAGALVAAVLIAVIAIPAIQLGLPDPPGEVVSEEQEPVPVQSGRDLGQPAPAAEAPALRAGQATADAPPSRPRSTAPPPTAAADEVGAVAVASRKASQAAPAPIVAAPAPAIAAAAPPPPPPPPPAEARAQAEAAASGDIVVTGSRIERPRLESVTPLTVVTPYGDFLSNLQVALRANDRRAVIGLVGFPLQVNFKGDVRTYRSPRDVERDYDRIFTAGARSAALNLRPDSLRSRDGGRLRGNDRIWFGCGRRSCPSAGTVRVREISP